MNSPRRGHVQVAFERRTGLSMRDWLLEHGPGLTRIAAATEIGYSSPSALKQWVARHMPAEFSFYRRPVGLELRQVTDAIVRQARGESWGPLAVEYQVDKSILRDTCRRYVRAMVAAC